VNVTVEQQIGEIIANTWYLNAAGNALVRLDENGQQVQSVDLSAHFTAARGCAVQTGDDPNDENFMSIWVAGANSDGHEVLRHFSADGNLIAADNMDLSLIITAEQIKAIPFVMVSDENGAMIFVSTPTQLYVFDQIAAQPAEASQTIDYATLGMVSPAISGGCISFIVDEGGPQQPDGCTCSIRPAQDLQDRPLRTGRRAILHYAHHRPRRTHQLGSVDRSDAQHPERQFPDVLRDEDSAWRIIRFSSNHDAPNDSDVAETFNLGHPIQDVAFTIEEMLFETVVTLWDGNADDPQEYVFQAQSNQALAGLFNSGQSLVEAQFVARGNWRISTIRKLSAAAPTASIRPTVITCTPWN
jgi:hypothetical protein